MRQLKTGLFLALPVCAVILIMGCADPDKNTGNGNNSKNVTIRFNADGGSPTPKAITIEKGSSMGDKYPPAIPEKGAYGFYGWFNGSTEYKEDTPVNSNLTLKAKWGDAVRVTGISMEKTLTVTMFAKQKLNFTISPYNATYTGVTWTSDAPDIVSVDDDGIVKALRFTEGGNSTDSSAAIGTAVITVETEDGGFTDTITVTATMAGQVDVMTLPPLKEHFADYFMMGNVFSQGDALEATGINNPLIVHHYNIVTPENNLKPSYMYNNTNTDETTTFETAIYNTANMELAMRMIDAAIASGLKVQGHTLLWHSQLPRWQSNLRSDTTTPNETVLGYMREFVTYVVSYYKGKIYAWDVLNEAFTDSNAASNNWRNVIRNGDSDGNPWYMRLGADFVYEGFKAARLADPDAILYYNDYNLDNTAKATMVRNMVRDVNEAWLTDPGYDGRLLIEGIGMQSHHNTSVTVNAIKATLDLFRPLGVKISVSELDVLCMPYNSLGGNGSGQAVNSTATNNGRLTAANLYGQYFQLFLNNADIVERVTFWGLHDNYSWRSRGLPLPFEGVPLDGWYFNPPDEIQAKPAYYKMIEALETANGG